MLPLTEEITEQKITNQIAAAVLLQLADNIYQNRHENVDRKGDVWYTVSNAFYRSAENTMNRLHRNFVQQYYRSDRAGDYLVNLNENYRQELELLDRIVSIRETAEEQERTAPAQTAVKLENVQQYREEETYQNLTDNRNYREGDRYYRNQTGNTTEERNYLQNFSNEEMYLSREQNTFADTEVNVRQEHREVTLEQLEEFHRHNVENRNKYYQKLEQLRNLQEKPDKAPDLQKMRREGLLALEHPQEMLQQLKEEGNEQQEQAAHLRQQELAFLPEDTQRIYEVLEQYLQTPERYRQAEAVTNHSIGRLMRDIELVERESREQIQTDIHTDRQTSSRSETFEQNWVERQPVELHYQEESDGAAAETAPEGRTAETVGNREFVERQLRKQELFHSRTDKTFRDFSETVVERWEENSRREPVQSAMTEEERRNRIALVHKQQTENEITEEIMEQLMNQNRVLENQTRVMEEVTQNSRTVERRITNQTTHEITQQTENLTEMISRGVQGRIGDITDQVYNRLEKRLQNERRRRGI